MKFVRLFVEMFKIALFVVGGGYAIIAVADEVASRKRGWTKEGELMDSLPLFQMIPGIMAGHAAVALGRKVAGFAGSCVALLGVALPSLIIFTLVSMGYDAIPLDNRFLLAAFVGLRAALTGVILAMVVRTWPKSIRGWRSGAGLVVALAALIAGVSPMVVIAAAIGLGVAVAAGRQRWGQTPRFCSFSFLAPLVFLKYGCVAFGGGYVLVPMYVRDFVGPAAPYLQLPAEEFGNLMALTQMTPGPIGINAATFFGYRLFGLGGALATTLCLLIPGLVLLSMALRSLERFKDNVCIKGAMAWLKPVTLALMVMALWSFAQMSLWTVRDGRIHVEIAACALTALTVTLMVWRKVGVVRLIFLCAGASVALEAVI